MDDQNVIRTIEHKRRFGRLPGIKLSETLLAAVGNPQKGAAFIHIAGTNGKGSTAAFLREICTRAGIRTGLFTSPHLIDFTERIQVDKHQIPLSDSARLGRRLLALPKEFGASMFDYCLAIALLYFKEQNCGLVILETGLGGRLDSTNVIEAPLVSVITRIGYDHTDLLGETLGKIAAEKAGILKRGTRAVLGGQTAEAMEVLKERLHELSIPYRCVETDRITSVPGGFCYPGEEPYQMQMLGVHQRENAMTAVLAARQLQELGYSITEEDLHGGIADTVWAGRMELLSEQPFLMIDGAHNTDGTRALKQSLMTLYPGEKFHFVIGVLADKDYDEMLEEMLPLADKVTAVTPESDRALKAEHLLDYMNARKIRAEQKENWREVFAPFLSGLGSENSQEKTVAFGSLYFIGEIRKFFQLSL